MINLRKIIRRLLPKRKTQGIADFYFPWLERYRKPDGSCEVPLEYKEVA